MGLNQLEQQLESEKNRKKMEEVEAKIRHLKEEEMAYLDRIKIESKDQLNTIYRDAEMKEGKMVEMWSNNHVKLVEQQMAIHLLTITKNLH